MAIRIREGEVTRRAQRSKRETKETINHFVRRDKKRDTMVRRHLEELGIEVTHETLDKYSKAYIEVLERGKRGRSEAVGNRQARELRADGRWYTQLAHVVTRYIDKDWKGFMWGDSLDDLYEEISEARPVVAAFGKLTADDIKIAVDIAVGKKLLRRKSENDDSSHEWVCVDLSDAA